MNVLEIKNTVMFQTNNDVDDVGDFLPYLTDYINEGYDRLLYIYAGEHLSEKTHPRLLTETDTPKLPEWTHRAIADYATWLIYRNGNSQKQQRGYTFRNSFEEVCQKIIADGGSTGRVSKFKNIPW